MHKTRVVPVLVIASLILVSCQQAAPSTPPAASPPATPPIARTASVEFESDPLFVSEPVSLSSPEQSGLLLSPNHDYVLVAQDKGVVVALPLSE